MSRNQSGANSENENINDRTLIKETTNLERYIQDSAEGPPPEINQSSMMNLQASNLQYNVIHSSRQEESNPPQKFIAFKQHDLLLGFLMITDQIRATLMLNKSEEMDTPIYVKRSQNESIRIIEDNFLKEFASECFQDYLPEDYSRQKQPQPLEFFSVRKQNSWLSLSEEMLDRVPKHGFEEDEEIEELQLKVEEARLRDFSQILLKRTKHQEDLFGQTFNQINKMHGVMEKIRESKKIKKVETRLGEFSQILLKRTQQQENLLNQAFDQINKMNRVMEKMRESSQDKMKKLKEELEQIKEKFGKEQIIQKQQRAIHLSISQQEKLEKSDDEALNNPPPPLQVEIEIERQPQQQSDQSEQVLRWLGLQGIGPDFLSSEDIASLRNSLRNHPERRQQFKEFINEIKLRVQLHNESSVNVRMPQNLFDSRTELFDDLETMQSMNEGFFIFQKKQLLTKEWRKAEQRPLPSPHKIKDPSNEFNFGTEVAVQDGQGGVSAIEAVKIPFIKIDKKLTKQNIRYLAYRQWKSLKQLQLRFDCGDEGVKLISAEKFPQLKKLCLDKNEITTVASLAQHKHLTSLYLLWNKITSIQQHQLPTSLIKLDLRGNQLEEIHLQDLKCLEMLHISNNKLASINLSDLKCLEKLYIQNNKLASINLSNLKCLEMLYISNNKLASIDLQENSRIKYLQIYCNPLKITQLPPSIQNLEADFQQIADYDFNPLNQLKQLCSSGKKGLKRKDIINLSQQVRLKGGQTTDLWIQQYYPVEQ